MERTLRIDEIEVDERLYPRNKINMVVVNEYVKAKNSGDIFPLIYVAQFKNKYILVDGRHRLTSDEVRGEKYIKCDVKTNFPDMESIYLAAVKSNNRHGVRFKRCDKLKIGYTMKMMGYVTEDIAKLTGLDIKHLEKGIMPKIRRNEIMSKKNKLPKVIREALHKQEQPPILSKQEESFINETNKEDWQISKLQEILDYIKTEDFETGNKKVCTLITKIKKLAHKRYPKL